MTCSFRIRKSPLIHVSGLQLLRVHFDVGPGALYPQHALLGPAPGSVPILDLCVPPSQYQVGLLASLALALALA